MYQAPPELFDWPSEIGLSTRLPWFLTVLSCVIIVRLMLSTSIWSQVQWSAITLIHRDPSAFVVGCGSPSGEGSHAHPFLWSHFLAVHSKCIPCFARGLQILPQYTTIQDLQISFEVVQRNRGSNLSQQQQPQEQPGAGTHCVIPIWWLIVRTACEISWNTIHLKRLFQWSLKQMYQMGLSENRVYSEL